MRRINFFLSVFILVLLWTCNSTTSEAISEIEITNKKTFPVLEPNRYNVGFLIMDGIYNTEFTAPYDIFQHTIFRDSIKAMNVFTVANTDNPIITFEGLKILPDYNYL